MKTYEKTADNQLRVIEQQEPKVVTYNLAFLKQQKEALIAESAKIQQSIAEVDALIAECAKVGVVEVVNEAQ